MISRREFCVVALAVGASVAGGCRQRVPVLKFPESADECADLFRFFIDPAFGLEQAIAGLGVTGEPRVMDDPRWRKVFTYEDQRGPVKSIAFETGGRDRPDAGKLTAIYIDYRYPISVSLKRLESYLGASTERTRKVAAELGSPVSMFTNLKPGQKEKEISSYSFFPEKPIADGYLKGDLWFRCDTTSRDSKSVDMLRYQRRLEVP